MRIDTLLLALWLDALLGDPPNRWHPVAWMGHAIAYADRRAPARYRLAYGALVTWIGALLVGLTVYAMEIACRRLSPSTELAIRAILLNSTLSLHGLNRAAAEVESALQSGDVIEARRLLSWHLVSRDVTSLSESQVAAAAIESVAENTSDGTIAPLFWYIVGGLPAAFVYRYVQTTDSMLGYHSERYEWLGKASAVTDDVLNLIPARITAVLFCLQSPSVLPVWRRDAAKTESPNAGHPMSAMAGALDVELEKTDHYTLNAGARQPNANDIGAARRVMLVSVGILAGCLAGYELIRNLRGHHD